MKILLVSDTHGKLDSINKLVEKTKSDLVIHAGDFGFYDDSSYRRLSTRELLLLVSHVSPGKEPLLTRLIIHFMPNFWISGHMGAPYTCIWNQFTIREMNESLEWFESQITAHAARCVGR